jgi:hypothetical protein
VAHRVILEDGIRGVDIESTQAENFTRSGGLLSPAQTRCGAGLTNRSNCIWEVTRMLKVASWRLATAAALASGIFLLASTLSGATSVAAAGVATQGSGLSGQGSAPPTQAQLQQLSASPATAAPTCGNPNAWHYGTYANAYFQRASFGSGDYGEQWDLYLTSGARSDLGSPVKVSIAYTYVNGVAANPPYAPHTEVNTYDFHSSMSNWVPIGQTHPTPIDLHLGNNLTIYWNISSTNGSGLTGYLYLSCTI